MELNCTVVVDAMFTTRLVACALIKEITADHRLVLTDISYTYCQCGVVVKPQTAVSVQAPRRRGQKRGCSYDVCEDDLHSKQTQEMSDVGRQHFSRTHTNIPVNVKCSSTGTGLGSGGTPPKGFKYV